MSNVVVTLDSVRKYRPNSTEEYRMLPRATCPEYGLVLTGDGALVKKMAKLLHENKCDISRGYEVRRGGTLCFKIVPLKTWVEPTDKRPEWLK